MKVKLRPTSGANVYRYRPASRARMPSRTVALALVAMVFVAGCSMLPGGDDASSTPTAEPLDSYGLVFASDTNGYAFDATVTVDRNGTEVFTQSLETSGNGTFENLTRFEDPGPYTVTVNTTVPAPGDENRSERFTTNGSLGTTTAVLVDFRGITQPTYSAPPRNVSQSVRVVGTAYGREVDRLIVDHRGRRIVDSSPEHSGSEPYHVADLPATGVYRIAVQSNGEWERRVVAVTNPDEYVLVELGYKESPAISVRSED